MAVYHSWPVSINSHSDVDALVAAGRYAEAACEARRRGELARAAELYERIWDFAAAYEVARQLGDHVRALRYALEGRLDTAVDEMLARLMAGEPSEQRAAIEVLAQRGHFARAAALAEELGERALAIDYYKRGHRDLDAARLLVEAARDREAGELLERLVGLGDSTPEHYRASLQLGLLLLRRMSYPQAARHLQEASRFPATAAASREALVIALAGMGLREAARDVLIEARQQAPHLPAELDGFLRSHRDAYVAAPSSRDEEVIGGRYRLETLLGAGGSGRVYRAHDDVSGRTVAIKLLHTATSRGDRAYERFVREARLAGALRHPNLVEVYEFSAEQGYLVMELMTGGSLADRQLPLAAAAGKRLALDVLAGLELAHQRGVIHRDIKPPNIFFDARGSGKLGDFGVAHLLDLGATQTGGLIGTLAYMAPEQITGAPLTIHADLYSLGVTLFEALTGRLPFLGPDFVAQHLGETPPQASAVAPSVASGWDPILARLLAKNPADRFASLDAARSAIEQLGGGASKPLLLPRSLPPRPRRASADLPAVSPAQADAPDAPRYQHDTAIGQTSISQLSRAVDTALNRTVMIERWNEVPLAEPLERRLFALARGGGPFVQRALSYDRDSGVAVYEAPAGVPMREAFAAGPPSPRTAMRLFKRLARAITPLHRAHTVHGVLDDAVVLVDDHAVPTLLVCGLEPVAAARAPRDDVAALIALLANTLGVEPALGALVDALAPRLHPQERAALSSLTAPRTGEELYGFADALEVSLLRQWRSATYGAHA